MSIFRDLGKESPKGNYEDLIINNSGSETKKPQTRKAIKIGGKI